MAVSEIASEQPDESPVDPPLPEEHFYVLSRPKQIAILARMALRLIPFVRFDLADSGLALRGLLALETCATLAALSARTGRRPRARALRPALQRLEEFAPRAQDPLCTYACQAARSSALAALSLRLPTWVPVPVLEGKTFFGFESLRADLQLASQAPLDRLLESRLWPASNNAVEITSRSMGLESLRDHYGAADLVERYRSMELFNDFLLARATDPSLLEGQPAAPVSGRPRLQTLADAALGNDADDKLDFQIYARALAGLIDNPETGTPLTVAINAPWGAGKSTLAKMIERRLKRKPSAGGVHPHVTCWFNAWMHDEAADLSAAFAAEVARSADRLRPWWRRLIQPLPIGMRPPRQRLWRRLVFGTCVLVTAGVATWLAMGNATLRDAVDGLLQKDGTAGPVERGVLFSILTGILTLAPKLTTISRSLGDFVRDPQAAATEGAMTRVRDQLGDLIRQATPKGSRFVVFVDDLERCRPPRAVDVLEVVNQLLCHPNVVVVVMADMAAVAACAEIKYEKLAKIYSPDSGGAAEAGGPRSYGRLYLQKIVQMQFDLPRVRSEKIRGLIESLAGIGRPAVPPAAEPDEGISLRKIDPAMLIPAFFLLSPAWVYQTMSRLGYPPERRLFPSPRPDFPRYVAAARLPWLLALAAALVLLPASAHPAIPITWSGLALLAALGVLGAASLAGWIDGLRQRRKDVRGTREVRVQVHAALLAGEHDLQKIAQLGGDRHPLVEEGLQLHLFNESELLREAEEEVLAFLPPLPRNAKRALNHLRLLLYIANEKKVLGGALTPRHLGKWVVLQERWPELARALVEAPGEMEGLEIAAAETEMFEAKIQRLAPVWAKDSELRDFCDSSTRLAPVLEQLLYLEATPA